MTERYESSRLYRWAMRRVQRKGLLPRIAAGLIAVLWVAAIVVFGIVEHLVDPETFDNVWLGMWWATRPCSRSATAMSSRIRPQGS